MKPLLGLVDFSWIRPGHEFLLGGSEKILVPSPQTGLIKATRTGALSFYRGCKRIGSGLEILLLEYFWSLELDKKLCSSGCLGFPVICILLMLGSLIPAVDALC